MLYICLPYDPTIQLLGIYPRKLKLVDTKTCVWLFRVALVTTLKTGDSSNVHQLENGQTNNGISIQWNATQQQWNRYMQRKGAKLRVLTVWFNLYKIQEKTDLIYTGRKQVRSCLEPEVVQSDCERMKGNFWRRWKCSISWL